MDMDSLKQIGQLTKSKGFAQRVEHYLKMGADLVKMNEDDIFIVDEARVLAELIFLNHRPTWHEFWDRQTMTAATGEIQFYTAKSTAATLDDRNMEGEGSLPRDQIFFAKKIAAHIDPATSQANKRIMLHDYIAELKIKDKSLLQRKVRGLASGEGLDGELNNGVPIPGAKFELPGFIRIPPQQPIGLVLKRLTAVGGGTNWLEFGIEGLKGQAK